MDTKFAAELDKFLAALARRFAKKGANAEVAVLTLGRPTCEHVEVDADDFPFDLYAITFEVPQRLYDQVADRRKAIEKNLESECYALSRCYPEISFPGGPVCITVRIEMRDDPLWRKKAREWLPKQGLSNQGRVRSDNVAPYEVDGLLFRSPSEIYLYHALKGRNISFAPLPVFIRGGDLYRRVELDFVIFDHNQFLVVELDGKQFHDESPVEAHERLIMLQREGARIERIRSSECDTAEKAQTIASQLIALLKKYAANK